LDNSAGFRSSPIGIFSFFRSAPAPTEERAVHVRPANFIEAPPFAGEYISNSNADKNTAVSRAIQLISNDMAKVPLRVMRRTGEGAVEDTSSGIWRLFDQSPNVEQSGFEFRRLITSSYCKTGNACCLIQKNGRGDVLQLLPLDTGSMSIVVDEENGTYNYQHAILGLLEPEEVLHFRFGLVDETGVWAYSPIQRARESLSLAKAQEKAGASVYRNAATPRMAIKHPGSLSDKASARLSEQFSRAHAGPESAGRAILLEEGMNCEVLPALELESQQYIAGREFQIQEVCRIFGIPAPLLSDLSRATYSNVQSLMRAYIDGCLSHHAALWAAEIRYKLLAPDQFIDIDLSYVQRGSFQDEIGSLSTAINSGFMTPNEARKRLNLQPLPGLDSPLLRKDTGVVGEEDTDEL